MQPHYFSTMPIKKENVLNKYSSTIMRPRRPSSSRKPAPNIIRSTEIPAQNNIRGKTSRGRRTKDEGNSRLLVLNPL